MANDTFNAGPGAGKPIGMGEGESPMVPREGAGAPPPGGAPNLGVRTMNSDLNAVKGGEAPKPHPPASTPPPPPSGIATKDIPAGGPSSFNLPQVDFSETKPPVPGAPGAGAPAAPAPKPPKKSGGKGLFIGIITIIIVVGLAALGYFVIYPMFFATPTLQPTAPPTSQTAPPPAASPAPAPSSTLPASASGQQPAPTSSAPTSTPPTAAAESHTSLFRSPAASLTVSTVTTGSTIADLNIAPSPAPRLIEVAYADQNGNPVGFASIVQTVFGLNLSSSPVLQNAWNDRTTAGFIYVDASGTGWLGYVTSVSSSSSPAAVKAAFAQMFEANSDWTGVFSSDPGTPGTWQTGNTSGVANRYLTFSNGQALNYGWSGNTLVISTSYAGFKDALSQL